MGAHESMEHAEHAHHASSSNKQIALLIAVLALFLAFSETLGKSAQTEALNRNIEASNLWAFFQAKSTKQSLAEAALDQLQIQRESPQISPEQRAHLDKQIVQYKEKVARYDKEKNDLKAKVEGLEKEYDRLNMKDDQFDISEALLSVGIALLGITALTQKRWLLGVAVVFAGFGLLIGTAGFVGWSIRPEWLAKVLGA